MQESIIVIPTYNERENISRLLLAIKKSVPKSFVIVVDDSSPDGTADMVKNMNLREVTLIVRKTKDGLGRAYAAGIGKALMLGAKHVLTMDADFSHDPADIKRLLAAAKKYDVVIGSRRISGGKIIGWGPTRKAMSAGAMYAAQFILGLTARDVTAGFRCYSRRFLETIDLPAIKSSGYAFQEEMLYRAERGKFSIKEIPVTFVDRTHGKSKLSKKDIFEFFLVLFRLRFGRQSV